MAHNNDYSGESLELNARKPLVQVQSSYAESFARTDELEDSIPAHRMTGRRSDIIFSSAVLTLPLLFSAALLGVVFYYRVHHSPVLSDDLQLPGTVDEPGVYYVNFQATRLFFIASFSSSVVPILVACAMTLASYPIAQGNHGLAQSQATAHLFTPYQFALTLRMLNGGGLTALWEWLRYVFGWKRSTQARALVHVSALLVIMTVLGFIVFLADTWLHVTTKAVIFNNIEPIATGNYSFGLMPQCTTSDNSFYSQNLTLYDGLPGSTSPCSVEFNPGDTYIISTESLLVLNNVSKLAVAATSDANYVYLGVPPQAGLAQQDYTATTFGIQTQCSFITAQCGMTYSGGLEMPFDCSSAFKGDVTAVPFNMVYFTDGTMTSNNTKAGIENPYFFGLATQVSLPPLHNATTGSDVQNNDQGGSASVMLCNSSLYDVIYSSVNGTVSSFATQLSNNSVTNIAQLTAAYGILPDTITPGYSYLLAAANLATLSQSSEQWSDQLALAYSKVAMSYFAGTVVALPALENQLRTTSVVSRIPSAPLWALVIANMLFVMMGIVLALSAIIASDDGNKDVQVRLSIMGLVADRFEGAYARRDVKKVEDLFEEKNGDDSARVGIVKAGEGGYTYSESRRR